MKVYELIDFIQRKINSILFRGIIIAYSILLINFYPNIFEYYIYIPIIILYISIYFLFSKHSKLRLLNDFLFLNLIILGKDPKEILIFIFLLLPIINSINFSGNKKSSILYLLTGFSFILQLCNYNHKLDIDYILNNIYPLIAILFLWVINTYTTLRVKIRNFREELNSVVDNFYLKKEEIKRPHKIYKLLIDVIHKNTSNVDIEDIICFTVIKSKIEKLVIINGSSFVWKSKFENENIITELRKKNNLNNVEFLLEGINKKYNLLLYTKVQDQEYLYIFVIKQSLPLYYSLIGFFRTLEPTFNKISSILLSEKKLQEVKNEEIGRLSERSQYVNRANKTMHFIRNRLGPFSNLVKMLEKFDSLPEDKIDSLKGIITKETERARIELANITERANNMLEKSTNPFVYTKLSKISLEMIFTILKRNVYSFFPNIEIEIGLNPKGNKKYVFLNEEGFELFLSDWLNNMSKYKKESVQCKFNLNETVLEISFINDHNLLQSEIEQMILDLTSDKRNEIMRRTTHGLYIIKSTLEDMEIPFEASQQQEGNLLIFKINLKTFENENSNI